MAYDIKRSNRDAYYSDDLFKAINVDVAEEAKQHGTTFEAERRNMEKEDSSVFRKAIRHIRASIVGFGRLIMDAFKTKESGFYDINK